MKIYTNYTCTHTGMTKSKEEWLEWLEINETGAVSLYDSVEEYFLFALRQGYFNPSEA